MQHPIRVCSAALALSLCGPVLAGDFCVSTPSSIGCVPALEKVLSLGYLSKTSGTFHVTAGPAPGGSFVGILLYHDSTDKPTMASPIATTFGLLCVAPFARVPNAAIPGGFPGTCTGSYDWDLQDFVMGEASIAPGDVLHIQGWYRDPANPGGANLTDAIGPIVVAS